MSWLYSQALVEEYSEENSLDGEQSAQLNGNHTQQAYCAHDKMTAFSRLSRFGMTYKPLTENLGEELLTLYLAGFRAKTLAQQEKVKDLTESEAGCGAKWRGSFTKYDLDLRLWKTHQCSLLGDLEPFLQTWPQWGLMRDGECWEQQTLAQTIRGTGFGLKPNGVDSFHTPNTPGLDGGSNSRKALKKRMWLTPRVVEVDETPENFRRRMNSKRPNDRKDGFGSLTMQVKTMHNWPTPTAHNAKETNAPSEANRNTPTLTAQAGGKLNPTWVEWLMGWPLGWTDLKPLVMDKCHYVQLPLGDC